MSHLTSAQRYTIGVMKKEGYSQKDISTTIGKDKSVISRELRRNCDLRTGEYRSDLAQRKYNTRQKNKAKRSSLFVEQSRTNRLPAIERPILEK